MGLVHLAQEMQASGAYNFPKKEFIVKEPMQIFPNLQSYSKPFHV